MKALIFAAGRGERLKPITDNIPKPLVVVRGKPLIQHHIEALYNAGINEIIINVSWLHEKIIHFIKDLQCHKAFKRLRVEFSIEPNQPLETGGGMLKALPLLGDEPFVVVNADVFTDFDFKTLKKDLNGHLVHLVLVNNPAHNTEGDFGLRNQQLLLKEPNHNTYTYAGIGCYAPKILKPPFTEDVFSIVPFIKTAIQSNQATAQLHQGFWHDVGTPERLNELNQQ